MLPAPSSIAAPSARRPGPSLRTSLVMLIGGIALALVTGLVGGLPLWRALTAPASPTPLDRTMHFGKGRYAVFERTGSSTSIGFGTGKVSFSENNDVTLRPEAVHVVGPNGVTVASERSLSNETLNREGAAFTDAVEFVVPVAGDYHVTIESVTANSVVIGREISDVIGANAAWFVACGACGLGALVGLVLLIVGAVRRSRADKQAAYMPYAYTGYGYNPYNPYNPYGQSSAPVAAPVAAPTATPAGWYPDPYDATRQRYWDGSAWTTHIA